MGCFNGTCAVTQLPIRSGDKVRLFFIVKHENQFYLGPNLFSPSDLWKLFSLPLLGEYNDYGSIENFTEDKITDYTLKLLAAYVFPVPNRMGGTFDKNNFTWEDALSFAHDEGLFVSDYPVGSKEIDNDFESLEGFEDRDTFVLAEMKKEVFMEKFPKAKMLTTMMVLEDVYQAIITTPMTTWRGEDVRTNVEAGAKNYVHQCVSSLQQMEEVKKSFAENDPNAERKAELRFERMVEATYQTNPFSSNFLGLYEGYGNQYLRNYAKKIEKTVLSEDPNDKILIEQLITQTVDSVMFQTGMRRMRKLYGPQGGAGSQEQDYDLHLVMAETITKFVAKKREEDREYDDIDDAEEAE